MTQNIWKGGNGVWGTAGNWSGGLPNSAMADVTITAAGAYTVTLAAGTSYTVDSVTLNNGGVSFDLNGTLSLAGTLADFMFDGGQFVLGTAGSLVGGTLDIDSGTLVAKGGHLSTADFILGSSGSIALGGTALTIGGDATLDGTVYGNNSAGNSLVITGTADLNGGMFLENHATLVVDGTFAEAGGYENYLYLGNGGTDNATVLINAGGVYDLAATVGNFGSYIYQYGAGAAAVINAGLVDSSNANAGDGYFNYIAATVDSTGTIRSDAGALQLQDGGTIGGTLAGAGEIDFTGGTFTLSPSIAISVGTLGFDNGAVVTLGGNLSLNDLGAVNGGTIALNGHDLTLNNALLTGDGAFSGPGNVTLTGTAAIDGGGFFVQNNATLIDAGTIETSGFEDELYLGANGTDSTTLLIDAGAAYSLTTTLGNVLAGIVGNGGNDTVINAGLVESSYENSDYNYVNYISATVDSTGTIRSDAGTLQLDAGGTIGGALTGAGEIDFNGGTFTLSPSIAISVGTLGFDGGAVVTLGGNLSLNDLGALNGDTIALNGHNLTLNNALLTGGGAFSGPGNVTLTGTAAIDGNGFFIQNDATLIDAGTIEASGFEDALNLGANVTDSITLLIDAGAAYSLTTTLGNYYALIVDYSGNDTVINAGLVESSSVNSNYNGINYISATVDSTGTIRSDTGTLQLQAGGTIGGLLSGAGEIDFTGGSFTLSPSIAISVATLAIDGGLVSVGSNLDLGGAFTLGGGGSVALNGDTLTLAGSSLLQGYVYGPGTVDVTGQAVLNDDLDIGAGAVLVDAGTITQTTGIELAPYGGTDSSMLMIDAGAVYDILDQGGTEYGISNNGISNNGTASIVNAGLLEITGFGLSNQSAQIPLNLDNTGTIADLGAGVLNLQGTVLNDGLITVSGNAAFATGQIFVNNTLAADVGQTGTIALGENAVFGAESYVSSSETFLFTSAATGAELIIADFASFAGTIAGFAAGEVIDLTDVQANGFTYANHILTLTEAQNGGAASLVGTLALGSFAGTISLDSDNNGGTELLLSYPNPTYSNPTATTAYKTWNGSNAAWTIAGDWSPSGVPGAASIAYINSGTVSYATTDTVYEFYEGGSAAKLSITSGKLTVDGGGVSDGTVLVTAGVFEAVTGYVFDGLVSLATGGTIQADAGALFFYNNATLAGTITGGPDAAVAFDGGSILLNSSLAIGLADISIGGASVTLGASQSFAAAAFGLSQGTLDLHSYSLTLSGASEIGESANGYNVLIDGIGTLDITGTAQLGYVQIYDDVRLIDAGLITQNQELYLSSTSSDNSAISITSTGTYVLADNGAADAISGGGVGSLVNAGLLEQTGYGNDTISIDLPIINTGTILAAEGTLALDGGGTLGGSLAGAGAIELGGGTFSLGGSLAVGVSTFILANDAELALGGHTLVLPTSADLGTNGYVQILGAGRLDITGAGTIGNLYVAGNAVIEDAGTMAQTGYLDLGYNDNTGQVATDSSSLLIDAGATYALTAAGATPSIQEYGKGTVTNNGLLETAGTYGAGAAAQIETPFINNGTVLVNTGSLQFTDGGTLSGTLAGTGEIDLDGGSFVLSSLTASIATLNASGATIALGSAESYNGEFIDENGLINLASENLTLSGADDMLGGTIAGHGTLQELGTLNVTPSGNYTYLTKAAVLEDSGVFDQTDGGVLYVGATGTDTATLLIDAGAIYNFESGQIYAGGTGAIDNNGLFAANLGDGTANDISVSFVNAGTVLAASGTLQLGGGIKSDASGTLSAGTWEASAVGTSVGTLDLAQDPSVVLDAASIVLSGAGAEIITGNSAPATIEASLSSIASTGMLQNLGGHTYATTNTLTDSGLIVLGGGVFAPAALIIAAAGTLEGSGTLGAPVQNSGEILATGGTLLLDGTPTGAGSIIIIAAADLALNAPVGGGETITFAGTGAVLTLDQPSSFAGTLAGLAASDIIDIAGTTVTAASINGSALSITLAGGTVLTETLASTLTGERFGISADGAGGSDLTLYREAAAAAIAPNPLAFGNHHVGDMVSAGLTIANTQPADGYSEALDAELIGNSDMFYTNAGQVRVTAGGSGTLDVSIETTIAAGSSLATPVGPGSFTGDAIVSLSTDGTGIDNDPTFGLGTQTIFETGALYAYAAASLATTIALGNVHVGAADVAALVLTDTGTNLAYTEALDASFSGTTGSALDAGSVSLLAAGATNSTSLTVGLSTGTAGALSGTAILGLVSDGTNLDGLGTTALPSQTVSVTGNVYNYATALLTGTVNLGQHHVGTAETATLVLDNTAAAGAFSEALDAKFSGSTLTSGSFTTAGTVTTLAAGASNATSLAVQMVTKAAGAVAGNVYVTLASDGTGIDGLGTTSLGVDTLAVTGAVFNLATAALGTTTISVGQGHVGVADSKTLLVKNSAATGAYSEGLDARFSSTSLTSGSFSTGGTISTLAAGGSASALAVTLAGAAGVIAGRATIALTSDGTGIDTLGTTALANQTVAVNGTLFNYATAVLGAGTLALGQHHAGDTVTGYIVLSNSAAKGVYSEELDASFSGTTVTHGTLTDGGTISLLAAGSTATNSLAVTLGTGAAGTVSGTATIALKSDGTGIDSLGTTALTAKTVAVTGAVYNYATAKLANSTISLGVVHVGGTLAQALTLANSAAAGAYSESLDAAFTGATGGATGSGSLSLLKAGATNSTSLAVGLSTGQSGVISGTEVLGLVSDGSGIDTLGTTTLTGQTITITGTVDNYATAALAEVSGNGTLSGSGNTYTLALGNVQQGAGSLTANLAVLNSATGLADLLGGGFTISNASGAFTDSGFSSFSGLGAGQEETLPSITLSGTNLGTFSELITLSSAGSNASGYNGALANITLDVTGTVVQSSAANTFSLTTGTDTINATGPDLIIAASGQLSAGDIINAGSGINTLALSGGGVFDMRAPATLTGISIVAAQENVGSLAQTLYLDAGFAGTVDAASGTAGSSLTVYGNLDSATINLGNGNDTVYVGSANEQIFGGGGNNVFYVGAGDSGVTINGGSGVNTLAVTGGANFQMTSGITNIADVVINDTGAQSTTLIANAIANLAITGGAGSDTITLGAASQSVTTGTGNTVIDATAANAGALIVNNGNATLNITTGGTAALNAGDEFLTVSLSSATNLALSPMSFITAIGSSGNDTITAMATQQTLTGGAGTDTLTGYTGFGDLFQDTTSGLNGDTIQYFGGNDLIDITNLARSGASLSYTGTSTAGTLSVSQSGVGVVSVITFTSGTNLSTSLFHLSSDGHGGTYIG